MPPSDEFFTRRVAEGDGKRLHATDLSRSLWQRMGEGYYFVTRTFTREESDRITESLASDPFSFYLTETGHVAGQGLDGTFEYANPVSPEPRYRDSVGELGSSMQYLRDDRNVVSANLRWILHRPPSDDRWRLCYSPLHTGAWKRRYKKILALHSSSTPWNPPAKSSRKGHHSVAALFDRHCEAMQVDHPSDGVHAGKKGYLDPVCNMIVSLQQCAKSSMNDANLVACDDRERFDAACKGHNPASMRAQRSKLRAMQAPAKGGSNLCMVHGTPYEYVTSRLAKEEDFVYDFANLGRANEMGQSLTIQECKNIFEIDSGGGDVIFENNTITAECNLVLPETDQIRPEPPPPPSPDPPRRPLPDLPDSSVLPPPSEAESQPKNEALPSTSSLPRSSPPETQDDALDDLFPSPTPSPTLDEPSSEEEEQDAPLPPSDTLPSSATALAVAVASAVGVAGLGYAVYRTVVAAPKARI